MSFRLGVVVATPGALEALERSGQSGAAFVRQHASKDWGDLCPEDQALNDEALEHGGRLLSAYHTQDGTRLWVITEADRSATTLLLPEEY